ncbi:hypothetical protein PHJA_002363400 [Phtheirospermum japonicum]|uniref:Uncharacterized protein n=1 Tax=Phtheirospermum japonicum TaxID=374723 RepID=A0A830D1A9_9LAMI|nr:hypothetical protein PHJA_002363400 [Phtheirospermum japonicum]
MKFSSTPPGRFPPTQKFKPNQHQFSQISATTTASNSPRFCSPQFPIKHQPNTKPTETKPKPRQTKPGPFSRTTNRRSWRIHRRRCQTQTPGQARTPARNPQAKTDRPNPVSRPEIHIHTPPPNYKILPDRPNRQTRRPQQTPSRAVDRNRNPADPSQNQPIRRRLPSTGYRSHAAALQTACSPTSSFGEKGERGETSGMSLSIFLMPSPPRPCRKRCADCQPPLRVAVAAALSVHRAAAVEDRGRWRADL